MCFTEADETVLDNRYAGKNDGSSGQGYHDMRTQVDRRDINSGLPQKNSELTHMSNCRVFRSAIEDVERQE